ncbi:uncharacterized protein LOC122264781 [Penaeus japonicus]|uniref:uncharacterized protein LOC122264781 n=1 Tax=Penaeus japonicus TaxID=27405 RepID=UPI001C713CCC|nr:uncharacterized protein LOC122264781 [Penaeus japonicus]
MERAQQEGQRHDNRPRPVLLRFPKQVKRDAAMRNTRKLKGTKIYFNDDLCPASQRIKLDQLPALNGARPEGKSAFFPGTKLVIRDRTGPAAAAARPDSRIPDTQDIQPAQERRNSRSQSMQVSH